MGMTTMPETQVAGDICDCCGHIRRAERELGWMENASDEQIPQSNEAALRKALLPLARLEIPKKPQGNAGAYSIRHDDIRAARAALDYRVIA